MYDMKELLNSGIVAKMGDYETLHVEKNKRMVFDREVDTYICKGGDTFASYRLEVGIDYSSSGHTRTFLSFEFNGNDTVEIEHTKNGMIIKTVGACERNNLVTLLTQLADTLEGLNEKYKEGGYA